MTTREEILHSSMRLLARDQDDVTRIFQTWNTIERVRGHESVGPVIADACRRLRRDQDRLFLLLESYGVGQARTSDGRDPGAGKRSDDARSYSGVALNIGLPEMEEVVQRGFRALERLSIRYASVYSLASALNELPIANMARSNLEAMRKLTSEFVGLLPLVTVQKVAATHPALPVNRSAGSQAQVLLRILWAPLAGMNGVDHLTKVERDRTDSSAPEKK